jgi:hypothetical protein
MRESISFAHLDFRCRNEDFELKQARKNFFNAGNVNGVKPAPPRVVKKADQEPDCDLTSMGLVCNRSNESGITRGSVIALEIADLVSEVRSMQHKPSVSEEVKNCIKTIGGGVLQIQLFQFFNGKYWQPTALFKTLISGHSASRARAWRGFLEEVVACASRGQELLAHHKETLHKFSFCLLVSPSISGCVQQVCLCTYIN